MKELLKEYLECIKNIQECNETGLNPYELNEKRVELHQAMARYLCLDSDGCLRLKTFFENLDKVCLIYSTAEEWRLRDHTDIVLMADNLYKFLTSAEARNYLDGTVKNWKWRHNA